MKYYFRLLTMPKFYLIIFKTSMRAAYAINLLLSFLLMHNSIRAQENTPFFAVLNKSLPFHLLYQKKQVYIYIYQQPETGLQMLQE